MTSDLDIYRTASVLIREHGEDAALEAAQRADAMLEKGFIRTKALPGPLVRRLAPLRRGISFEIPVVRPTGIIAPCAFA